MNESPHPHLGCHIGGLCLKIAFITTLQKNIGDDFVREGIRAVLDDICSYQPYLINKHRPEITCTGPVPEDAPEPLGDKILDADAVIQCGAPVYWNLGPHPGQKCSNAEWITPLWYDRIARIYERIPVLNIAAGACQGYFGVAPEITDDTECRSFIRDIHGFCRIVTVRDRMAYDVNSSLQLPVMLAPCASLFAWRRLWHEESQPQKKTRVIALNFMRLAGHYDIEGRIREDEWRKRFCEIARLLGEAREEILPVAHNLEERDLMEQLLPGHPVFYSFDYADYFPVYAQCCGGVFNRVHGAMLLAGCGTPSVVIGNDSRTRMVDELGLPRWHVSEAEPKVVVDRLLEMVDDRKSRTRLLEIEDRAFQALSDQVQGALQSLG